MAAPTLEDVRTWLGGDAAQPDPTTELRLAEAYAAAVEAVEGAVATRWTDGTETYPAGIRQAIFLVTSRLMARPASPQGVAGFDALGNVYRVLASDPDVKAVVGPYLDLTRFA